MCRQAGRQAGRQEGSIPFRLLLLGLVAILKTARRTRRRSGSMKIIKVVKESRCNDGIN